jgi:hypothetical protein
VWSGPGRTIEPSGLGDAIEPSGDGKLGIVRFEVALAELGVSCASTREIEISPYTTHVSGSTSLHPIATLTFARGKVVMPIEMVGGERESDRWQRCVGASVQRAPEPETTTPQPGSAILMSPTGSGSLEGFDDNALGGLCGPREHRLALPPALTPSIDGVSGDETELVWWTAPLALLGIGLAMWRATTRAAA